MRIIRAVAEMKQVASALRRGGSRVGLVPTMGALHAGHRGLMARARGDCDQLVVSLFVNPAQFGPDEDLDRYPRAFETDAELCRACGVDLVFAPEARDMYPPGFCTWIEAGGPAERCEGDTRPGHFRGVVTVVLKLCEIIQPDFAVFGQKDAQQVAVIRRAVLDLNLPVAIVVTPTVREEDGLALSSRNQYLTPEERRRAPLLYGALCAAAARYARGEHRAADLIEAMRQVLEATPGLITDYAEVVDAASFSPVEVADASSLLIVAGRFGSTRLIDNLPLGAQAGALDAATAAASVTAGAFSAHSARRPRLRVPGSSSPPRSGRGRHRGRR